MPNTAEVLLSTPQPTAPQTTSNLLYKLLGLLASYDKDLRTNTSKTTELLITLYGLPTILQPVLEAELLKNSLPELNSELNSATDSNLEDLLLMFDKQLGTGQQKKTGSFYTPTALADFIIKLSLGKTNNPLPATLDPCCGSGIFIVRLLDELVVRHKITLPNLCAWLSTNLFSLDLNPVALLYTWLGIKIKLWQLFPQQNGIEIQTLIRKSQAQLICGNFLLSTPDLSLNLLELNQQKKLGILNMDDMQKLNNTEFELIIGNPPYGLSRAEQISALENKLLKKIYADYLSGKPNKYLLFIARASQLLAKAGSLGFVVPNSWLGIKSAKALRKHLLDNKMMSSLHSFIKQPFEELGLEAVVTIISKNTSQENFEINQHLDCSSTFTNNTCLVDYQLCHGLLAGRIPLEWQANTAKILQQIAAVSKPLTQFSEYFQPYIALQAYAVGKGNPPQTIDIVKAHSFHADAKLDNTYLPYIEGRDISNYSINWSGTYLSHGPWLAEPQNLERFNKPRIILREILGKYPYLCIASYTEQVFLYNKSCLHILMGRKGNSSYLLALLAILNSSLAGFIIRYSGHKSQRKLFPKIVNDDLREFPLPQDFLLHYQELADLASAALEKSANVQEMFEQKEIINKKVLELYKLPIDLAL